MKRFVIAVCLAGMSQTPWLLPLAGAQSQLDAQSAPVTQAKGQPDTLDRLETVATKLVAAPSTATTWEGDVRPFLKMYCLECHSGDSPEAGVDLGLYESDATLPEERSRWNQIRGLIAIGAMPPVEHDPQPTAEQRAMIAQWIHGRVNTVDCDQIHDPGQVTVRRLNNTEYDNSVRDLLGIDFQPSVLAGFPSDEVGDGFDNQGSVLSLSQIHLEKYLQAATLIAERALAAPESFASRSTEVPTLFLGDRQSITFMCAEGEYEIKPRMQFSVPGGPSVQVALFVDDQPLETFTVTNLRQSQSATTILTAGMHRFTLQFVSDGQEEKKRPDRRVEVQNISLKGPPLVTEAYSRLLAVRPNAQLPPLEAAQANLEPIIRRAYRRRPAIEEVQRVVNVVQMALDKEMTFEQAVGHGLRAILMSPHFLFRVETLSSGAGLDDYALASRLSYFLWASMPDDRLLEVAEQGVLSQPDVLAEQVRRMLQDPRAAALVKRFFGQYLGLENLRDAAPNSGLFPQWNERMRQAIVRETEMFCQEIVDRDLPVEALMTGDFTFVNPRLAELYGVAFEGRDPAELFAEGPGIYRGSKRERDHDYLHEDRWVRIGLPANRSGVLTHASVLTVTSNSTATSPVKRGKWIMETILGDPPPPAPPNVPAFEETQKEHRQLTLREQLAIHRANPSCASCHDVMDPLGLGFENFDAIGRWRDTDAGLPVDSSGQLADGREFSGPIALIELLRDKSSQFYRFFGEKLLTYALGRSLEPYDNCAVDDILEAARQNDYRFSSFVAAIVTSEPFTKRRTEPQASDIGLLD
ncbi:MAG: DUF1592 domain-containing protein [Pirellulaceae bacterium]|nr:DUF1592 domain-containing protein [Pirellulaceae bacterium]